MNFICDVAILFSVTIGGSVLTGAVEECSVRVLLAAGGTYPGHLSRSGHLSDVEVVSVGPGYESCTKLPDYPFEVAAAAGAFVDGKARICGGRWPEVGDTPACYEYALGDDSWTLSKYSLSEERHSMASLLLPNGMWLIMGGSMTHAFDIYSNGVMKRGPELWLPLSPEGCVVNSTHIFLDGLLINIDTWETINILVKMRFGFACGMVENERGERELVLVGGVFRLEDELLDASTLIFNFKRWFWRPGPRLHVLSPVAVQMSKSFLVIGGFRDLDDEIFLDTIYEFDNVNYTWIERDEMLAVARTEFVAMSLPDDWGVC